MKALNEYTNEEMIVHMQVLQQQEGWQILEQVMAMNMTTEYSLAAGAKNGHEMAKHFGAHFGIQGVISWPQREILNRMATIKREAEESSKQP